MKPKIDRRKSSFRRQINQGFCSPDGIWSPVKMAAVFSQIALLYHFGKNFDEFLDRPEALLIVLTFLILPDVAKKLVNMKYGNGSGKK